MKTWYSLKNEIDYSIKMISALGAYPLHLVLIIVFYKLELYSEALFVGIGFIGLYLIGTPLRYWCFQERAPLNQQERVGLSATQSSFPSYHVARLTFLSLFFCALFNYEWDIVLFFVFVTLLVAFTRVRFGHHYMSDVVGGISLGIVLYFVAAAII